MEKAEPTANPTRVPTGPPINVTTAVESATEPPVHQTFKGGSFEPPYSSCSTLFYCRVCCCQNANIKTADARKSAKVIG